MIIGYYHQPMTLIDAYKFSFFPTTIKLWNQLPADVINSSTPNEFCNNLSRVRNPKNQLSQINPPTIVGCSL